MADETTRVVDLPVKATSNISLADYLMGIDAAEGYQMLIGDLARKIIETYTGSSLAGSAQTLKAALDGLNTKVGNASMGTTATTLTGAIAEHEGDISELNSKPCIALAFAAGRLSENQELTTAYRIVNMGEQILNIGNAFTMTSDGGFKPNASCTVRVTGYIRITGLTAGDAINLAYGVYSSGSWASEGYAMRITAPGSELTLPIEYIASVPSSGTIYLRAANQTASRGTINFGQCMVERLALS